MLRPTPSRGNAKWQALRADNGNGREWKGTTAQLRRALADVAAFERPSPAERHILQLLARGLVRKQIAAVRGTSQDTVKNQMHELRRKMGVATSTQMVYQAVKKGWIE